DPRLVSSRTLVFAIWSSVRKIHYARFMEIPLVLRLARDGRLVYAIPAWYRAVMGFIAACVLASLFIAGGMPGIVGWIVIALVCFGGLYEERWTFDRSDQSVTHRAGLVFWSRETRVRTDSIATFRLSAFIRGSIPGSDSEKADKEAALALGRGDDFQRKRSSHKKAYLSIVMETVDGSSYLLNMMNARKGSALREAARNIAEHCGAPLIEG
ncbi:MAG: hypothetical protein Q8M76_14885, partial [Spirochaetaceae bacterium]|nr:hypothetical protein [Spirochaetaceae bacterium]